MHEKVAAYLEQQRQTAVQKEQDNRERKLVELGLWEKEFDPEEKGYSSAYPFLEDGRYFRMAAVAVTDEEWAEICSHAEKGRFVGQRQKNAIGQALWILALVIYAAGALLGIALYLYIQSYGAYGAALLQMLSLWIVFGITGTAFLGFSEIIRLLDRKED